MSDSCPIEAPIKLQGEGQQQTHIGAFTRFGGLLAIVEGWSYETCFWLVLADLTHTNLPVVLHAPHAEDVGGKLIVCFVGILGVSVFVFAVGVVGGPLMDPITQSLGFVPNQKCAGSHLFALPFCHSILLRELPAKLLAARPAWPAYPPPPAANIDYITLYGPNHLVHRLIFACMPPG